MWLPARPGGIMQGRFFRVVAAAVTLAAVATPSASAARSTSAGGDSTIKCPGGTLLSAVSARRLPAGSTAYKYVLPDGRSFENIAPPTGFNVATASNALLAELNIPQACGCSRERRRDGKLASGSRAVQQVQDQRVRQVLRDGRRQSGNARRHAGGDHRGAARRWRRAVGSLGRAHLEQHLVRLRAEKRAVP